MSSASNEEEWAADRKVGFAMGILLIGVVAALFFRNEPLSVQDAPSVEREELIDSRLRDRDVTVYSDDDARTAGEETTKLPRAELLSRFGTRDADVALPVGRMEPPVVSDFSPAVPRAAEQPLTSKPANSALFRPPTRLTERPAESTKSDPLEADDFLIDRDSEVVDRSVTQGENYEEYTVRYGDTLTGIAREKLGASSRYQEIYEANKDRMASPDQLRVGSSLRIPRL